MSAEIVEGPRGLYVVTGHPTEGYQVRPVGPPIASYRRKYEAAHAVTSGEVEAADEVES